MFLCDLILMYLTNLSTSFWPPTLVTAAMYLIIIFDASVLPDPLSPVKEKTCSHQTVVIYLQLIKIKHSMCWIKFKLDLCIVFKNIDLLVFMGIFFFLANQGDPSLVKIKKCNCRTEKVNVQNQIFAEIKCGMDLKKNNRTKLNV